MSRTARRIAPLLTSLSLMAGVAFGGGMLAGCADENDPATHVKKLQDPATRPQAVQRLIQFYEDKMTADKGDRNGPNVKPLLEMIVAPMTERCVGGDLDDRTNSKLIKFLADTHDPRTEACLVKTLKDYKPDNTEEDVRAAARAVKAMKLKSAAGPLMEVFTKMKASKPKAQSAYRDVHDAMLELLDPGWETQLITMLGPSVDPKDQAGMTDQMFWQITAAEILGHMKSAKAVKPLIKIVLNPYKASAQTTAILALVKIGKPTVEPTVAVLKGDDKELVDYSKAENMKAAAGDKGAEKAAAVAHVGAAALILATIGREETGAPLIDAIGKSEDPARSIIARELTKLPKSQANIDAFKAAFEKATLTQSIPGASGGAREVLLDASGMFFDPSLIPWMAKTVKDMKGEEADLEPIREATFQAMLKLVNNDADNQKALEELNAAKATVDGKPTTVGKGFEKEYKQAKDLLGACAANLDCYVGKLTDPASQTEAMQFTGIKSAYMIGELGNEGVKNKLFDSLPKITNPALRFLTVSLIDFFSPKGDAALAAKMQKMVDDAEGSKDPEKQRSVAPFKTVIYRLNAKAQ